MREPDVGGTAREASTLCTQDWRNAIDPNKPNARLWGAQAPYLRAGEPSLSRPA